MHAELKKQDSLQEIDMQVLANIIEKCFKIKEQADKIQAVGSIDLDAFITKVEEQVERISEMDLLGEMDRSSLPSSFQQQKPF